MKSIVVPIMLLVGSQAYAETIRINNLYGCDTVDAQKLKLKFLKAAVNCQSGGCKPGTAEISYANYNYIQETHCRRIPAGDYKVLDQAPVPGGRVVRVKADGQLLWVLD
jgi:hypothetical protein